LLCLWFSPWMFFFNQLPCQVDFPLVARFVSCLSKCNAVTRDSFHQRFQQNICVERKHLQLIVVKGSGANAQLPTHNERRREIVTLTEKSFFSANHHSACNYFCHRLTIVQPSMKTADCSMGNYSVLQTVWTGVLHQTNEELIRFFVKNKTLLKVN